MEQLIIANCSAFFGDRLSAAAEMVRGGPIDVLTGDYLAELTMAILHRQRSRAAQATGGWASTFVKQVAEVWAECLQKKIKIVANAGGLNPRGLAAELKKLAGKLGLAPKIAFIEGDDLSGRLQELAPSLTHLDKQTPLDPSQVLTANAYLGGFGIADALSRGADIVVTGRVTDAALVVGPAAWRFGWRRDEWDKLAGAVAAGHIIECGTQATGGNYSFFDEVSGWSSIGFPWVEMHADGSFVVGKHPGTGGLVSTGTVTAQLLYEIESPRYFNPDVTARFDTLTLTDLGNDRVRVDGARGEPPPPTTKVAINLSGGFRNSMMVRVPEPHVERKRDVIEETLFEKLGGRERFATTDTKLIRSDRPDPRHNDQAFAILKITVMDRDAEKVGRAFSQTVVEMATANVPGLSLMQPPREAEEYLVYWPALVDSRHLPQHVFVDGEERVVEPLPAQAAADVRPAPPPPPSHVTRGPLVHQHFGRLFGTRSGDKGGNANLGVWARSSDTWAFLRSYLTVARLKKLLPDLDPYVIDRYELPNLLALNFYVRGLLGDGVASSTRLDPQAKTLGEYLRAKLIDIPSTLL
jgi:Acyclic terpene utilisation family protein AtuA